MQLVFDLDIGNPYKSLSQRARVLSERWFERNCYCLACDSDRLSRTTANTSATDFLCPACGHRYELKTFQRRPTKSLVDGAYGSLMSRINSRTTPTLCLLERNVDWHVRSLTAIHSSFLIPSVIEKRPPLKETARRAGWVGCNIRLDRIPSDGEISWIEAGTVQPQDEVRLKFRRYLPLIDLPTNQRSWIALTLRIVRGLGRQSFSLAEVYSKEQEFSSEFPQNRHVREKIRQQLQALRDLGVLKFNGNGRYELTSP
jgi:type II restriction enzyme